MDWKQIAKLDKKKNISRVSVITLTIDPIDPNIVFAGTKGDGVLKTENGGENWVRTQLNSGEFYSIAVDPSNDSIVYAAGFLDNWGKIFKSRDKGVSWQEIYSETHEGSKVLTLAINKDKPNEIYAGNTEGALFKSTDGGESWVVVKWISEKAVKEVMFGFKDTNRIYVVTETGLFKSSNGGKDWVDLTKNFKRFEGADKIYGIVGDPYYDDGLFSVSAYGLLKSTDGGKNWREIQLLVRPGTSVLSCAVNPHDSRQIYLGLGSTLYKSTDGGRNWTTRDITNNIIRTLAVDPKTPSIIYIGVEIKEEKKK
jgi:photosystem II stability/assembly factor-like uncharacterized protein